MWGMRWRWWKWVLPPSSPDSSCNYDFGYGHQTVVPYASRGHWKWMLHMRLYCICLA
jgi:hypothetical protein